MEQLNEKISKSHVHIKLPITKLVRATYVCESEFASSIAKFKLGVANLGNRVPRFAHQVQTFCPLCPTMVRNNEEHLVYYCPSVTAKRYETGIASFFTQGVLFGHTIGNIFQLFVNGLDLHGNLVPRSVALERGKALQDLAEDWLKKW